jgi:hypothetical protein
MNERNAVADPDAATQEASLGIGYPPGGIKTYFAVARTIDVDQC